MGKSHLTKQSLKLQKSIWGDEKMKRKNSEKHIMPLTKQQKYEIRQVAATMQIENMPLTVQAYKNLIEVASGKKTVDQVAEEIKKKYMHTE